MFLSCVLKACCWFSFNLLGQLVIAHFGMARSIPAHAQYLLSWSSRDVNLLAMAAISFA